MSFDLHAAARDKILVVAHRGSAAGNIPCNTIPAYEAALLQGADMIEIDVEMSRDGKLFVFHPGMEQAQLFHAERLCNMDSADIAGLRYVNYDNVYTQFGVVGFDEVMERFKGRCFINIDKFWGHPKEIYEAVCRHGMQEQVLVKSAPSERVFSLLEALAPTLPYMPIVEDTHPLHEELMRRRISYVGAEVLFTEDSAEVASPDFIDRMHRDGRLVWVNSIIYNHRRQLAAGHSDDTAICGDRDRGWGWLARRGFDLIQTDWTGMLIDYLKQEGLYFKNQAERGY